MVALVYKRNYITFKWKTKTKETEMKVELDNCYIIVGMEPLYTSRDPTSWSFAIIYGKQESVLVLESVYTRKQ